MPVLKKDWRSEDKEIYHDYLCIPGNLGRGNTLINKVGNCAYAGLCTKYEYNDELKSHKHIWSDDINSDYVCSGPGSKIYGFIKITGRSLYGRIYLLYNQKRVQKPLNP